jgi:nitrogen regulatory protein PII
MLQRRRLLTIITEAAIEKRLLQDLEQLGARGYTISEARGKGSRGERSGNWRDVANIRIELIVSEPLAAQLFAHLQQHYYDHYAMVAFLQDVDILRPDKF